MSRSFFAVLPSNTRNNPPNKTNKFRIRLPKVLKFDSDWVCGVHSVVYPHSWSSDPSEEDYLNLHLRDGQLIRIKPRVFYNDRSHLNIEVFTNSINDSITDQIYTHFGIGRLKKREAVVGEDPQLSTNIEPTVANLKLREIVETGSIFKLEKNELAVVSPQAPFQIYLLRVANDKVEEKDFVDLTPKIKLGENIFEQFFHIDLAKVESIHYDDAIKKLGFILDNLRKILKKSMLIEFYENKYLIAFPEDNISNYIVMQYPSETGSAWLQRIPIDKIVGMQKIIPHKKEMPKGELKRRATPIENEETPAKKSKSAWIKTNGKTFLEMQNLLKELNLTSPHLHTLKYIPETLEVESNELNREQLEQKLKDLDLLFPRYKETFEEPAIRTSEDLTDEFNLKRTFPDKKTENTVWEKDDPGKNEERGVWINTLGKTRNELKKIWSDLQLESINFNKLKNIPETLEVKSKELNREQLVQKLKDLDLLFPGYKEGPIDEPAIRYEKEYTEEFNIKRTMQNKIPYKNTIWEKDNPGKQNIIVDKPAIEVSQTGPWIKTLGKTRSELKKLLQDLKLSSNLDNLDEIPKALEVKSKELNREQLVQKLKDLKLLFPGYKEGPIDEPAIQQEKEFTEDEIYISRKIPLIPLREDKVIDKNVLVELYIPNMAKKHYENMTRDELLNFMRTHIPSIKNLSTDKFNIRFGNLNREQLIAELERLASFVATNTTSKEEAITWLKKMGFRIPEEMELPLEPVVEEPIIQIYLTIDAQKSIAETHFGYDRNLGRFYIEFNNSLIRYVTMTDRLAYILGYEKGLNITNKQVAKYIPDLRADIHQLFIYETSGVTENIIVGDKLTSLLRIINVNSSPGDVTEVIYNTPIFKRIIAKEISDIELEIKTSRNTYVPFNYGNVIVTLLFKRIY